MKHSLIRLCGAGALVLPLSVMAEAGTDYAAQSNSLYNQTSTGGGNLMLFNRLQSQEQAINELRGRIEKLEYQLKQQTEFAQQRYLNLEERMLQGGSGPSSDQDNVSSASNDPGGGDAGRDSSDPINQAAATGNAGSGQRQAGASRAVASQGNGGSESEAARQAYQDAFALVQQRQFDQAIGAFESFNQQYGNSPLSGNAYYWLGELYSAKSQLSRSAAAFQTVIDDHANNSKVADALYKLGLVRARQGQSEQSRTLLKRVISDYPNSNAASLAEDFLDRTSG